MPIDALSVFCAQLTSDLLAIAKFLSLTKNKQCSLSFIYFFSVIVKITKVSLGFLKI